MAFGACKTNFALISITFRDQWQERNFSTTKYAGYLNPVTIACENLGPVPLMLLDPFPVCLLRKKLILSGETKMNMKVVVIISCVGAFEGLAPRLAAFFSIIPGRQ